MTMKTIQFLLSAMLGLGLMSALPAQAGDVRKDVSHIGNEVANAGFSELEKQIIRKYFDKDYKKSEEDADDDDDDDDDNAKKGKKGTIMGK